MNLCVLLLSAALQASPAIADDPSLGHRLSIRVPDVQGMLDALDQTPWPRFLESETLKPLLDWAQDSGWSAPGPVRGTLAQALGDPRWGALIPGLSSLSLSAKGGLGSAQALLVLEMSDAETASSAQELLVASWNLAPQGRLWTGARDAPEGSPAPPGHGASLALEGQRLLLALGEGSLEALQGRSRPPAAGLPEIPSALSESLSCGEVEKLPQDAQASYLWMAHSQDPYAILRDLDQSLNCFGGRLAKLPGLELSAAVGQARLEVSRSGYRLDYLEPVRSSDAPALDPARLGLVDSRAMLLVAARLPQAELLERLQPLLEVAQLPGEGVRDFEAALGALLAWLDQEILLVSNAVNSTSPPKSYLSFALKPGEDQEAKVLAACSAFMSALTKFPVSQRDYHVRNKFTKERQSWPVHTLVIPENPDRGLLTPSISPSFVVDGGRLLVSPRAMYLKNELKRRHDGKASQEKTAGALLSRELELPPGAYQVLLFDWADQIGTLINFFPMLALAMPQLPIDAAGLPSAAEVQRAFPPIFGYSAPFGGGTWHHLRSAVGLEVLLGLLKLNAEWQGSLGDLLPG